MTPPEPSITCPHCYMTSYNLLDVINRYCGNCHTWLPARTVPPETLQEAEKRWREVLPEERLTSLPRPEADDGH